MDRQSIDSSLNLGIKTQLSLQALRLKNVSGFLKISDPYAVVSKFHPQKQGEKPQKLGRTEVIKNDLSPKWSSVISLDWNFGEDFFIRVDVYDKMKKSEDRFMGYCEFNFSTILRSEGSMELKKVQDGKGRILAHVEKFKETGDELSLQLSANNLRLIDRGAEILVFFTISKKVGHDKTRKLWKLVYRSDCVRNNEEPIWEKMKLNLSTLCNCDLDRPLLLELLDYKKRKNNPILGRVETSVRQLLLLSAVSNKSLRLHIGTCDVCEILVIKASLALNESVRAQSLRRKESTNYDNSIAYKRESIFPGLTENLNVRSRFLEYLSAGCELSLCVSIDFSSCTDNAVAGEPQSLHHINETGRLNEYEIVIHAVVSLLIRYDSDNKVPVWGFGVEFNGETRNCFQCGSDVEVDGVNGIIDAYRSTLKKNFALSKSKDWSSVIDNAAKFARKAQNDAVSSGGLNYTVLLILSHGIVDDLAKTINAINESKSTPLSIIIVGVGGADFGEITKLEERCTFVKFRDHSSASLSKVALSKVPMQLEQYFMERGISPKPPRSHEGLDKPDSIILSSNTREISPGHKILDKSVPIISSNKYDILQGMKINVQPINMSSLTLESHMPSSKDMHPSHKSSAVEKKMEVVEEIRVHTTDTSNVLATLQSLSKVCDFNICVAIDFTLSNGYPGDRRSLHFRDASGQYNEYERAIEALCPIISKYDTDNKVSVRGFGIEINGEAKNCFRMGEEGEVFGVKGVLDSYRHVLNETFAMTSCKDWSVVIGNASKFAMKAQIDAIPSSERSYTVLVIFSNGPPDEVSKTISALEKTKSSPLSVVVVGVGGTNFNEIIEMLEERNISSCFVNFCDHLDTMLSLAEAALSKVPQQFEEYYKGFSLGYAIDKITEPVFSNYLSRGYQFSLCLAIDFSASNGNPRSQQSLHHFTDGKLNNYEKAIIKMVTMFIKYDTDNKVPVRGFGIDLDGSPNNCFQIGNKSEADGIGDILDTYRSASQQTFDMSLSKDWSVVILNAVDFARKSQNDANFSGVHNYTVLLILSNGPVDNIDATIDALHEVASVPLSVVVVGIGDSDFSEITQVLEGDLGNDVITFVNFHDDVQKLKELEEVALCNVAHQLEHYFI
mmetsp:Transcript_37387/g.73315  ORF Transcript_37387/g.73315 Transcript_37387/m.73315 type:complete len:1124 (+) Transcript_37387:73-3444(+)